MGGQAESLLVARHVESRLARNGLMFMLELYHSKFYPTIPTTVEPLIEHGVAFVGTVDNVHRWLAAVQQQLKPEYFLVFCDQGLLPLDEVKQQIELFAKVMPEFRTTNGYA